MTSLCTLIGHSPLVYNADPHKWDELMGIELELEDVSDPEGSYTIPRWTVHQDASLRNGMEFVTSPAMGGAILSDAISSFYRRNFSYESGPRTSTHIHVNMKDSTAANLASMVMITYMIEDGIYQAVEESRKWGGYSVSLSDMPTTRLRALLAPPSITALHQAISPARNAERYYGMNTNMRRHGTVEFRYFPGGPTERELREWVDLVVYIKKACKRFTVENLIATIVDPAAVVSFLMAEFGDWASRLLNAVGPERMFNAFSEVATMASDEDPRDLPSSVVWITPAYVEFTSKALFKEKPEAVAYLKNILASNSVFSKSDWNYYLSQARNVAFSRDQTTSLGSVENQPYPFEDDEEDEDERQQRSLDYSALMENIRETANRSSTTAPHLPPPRPSGDALYNVETGWSLPDLEPYVNAFSPRLTTTRRR